MTLTLVLARWLAEKVAVGPNPLDAFWGWVGTSVPAGALLNGLGLGVLAVLFARDLILTRGQHTRQVARIEAGHAQVIADKNSAHAEIVRIMGDSYTKGTAEITAHHAALIRVKDEQLTDMRERMTYYRDARLVEQERANRLTDQLAETVELAKLSAHILKSIDEAAKDATP